MFAAFLFFRTFFVLFKFSVKFSFWLEKLHQTQTCLGLERVKIRLMSVSEESEARREKKKEKLKQFE